MNLIITINSLNTTKRVSAEIVGDLKIGFLVSVRLHNPNRKSMRNLECGKVSLQQLIKIKASEKMKVA